MPSPLDAITAIGLIGGCWFDQRRWAVAGIGVLPGAGEMSGSLANRVGVAAWHIGLEGCRTHVGNGAPFRSTYGHMARCF